MQTAPVQHAHTDLSRLLREYRPVSPRLNVAVRTGKAVLPEIYAQDFAYLKVSDPESAEVFDRTITQSSRISPERVADALDMTDVRTVVDVGGGQGHLVATLLHRYPQVHAVLCDLDTVVADGGGGSFAGELVAACVAGALSLRDGAPVVALRGRLITRELSGAGGMISVGLPVEVVQERLFRWEGRLSIGAINGPASVVVSGPEDALAEVMTDWASDAHLGRVAIDYASHLAVVERVEQRLRSALALVRPGSSAIPFYSSVAARRLDASELDGDYWYRNLRSTVDFHGAMRQLLRAGFRTLSRSVRIRCCWVVCVTVLGQRALGWWRWARCVVTRGVFPGCRPPWRSCIPRVCWWTGVLFSGAARVGLPTYAFQRERYWLDETGPTVSVDRGPDLMAEAGVVRGSEPVPAGQSVGRRDLSTTTRSGATKIARH